MKRPSVVVTKQAYATLSLTLVVRAVALGSDPPTGTDNDSCY